MLITKYRSSEEEVRSIQAPEFTESWHPISHGRLLDFVLQALDSKGLQVWKSEYGLMDKDRMFGVLDLQLPEGIYRPDLTLSIGVRNSIDKSLAAAVAVGNRVFVCDNLSFSGQVVLTKKHTTTIEEQLPNMIANAIDSFVGKFAQDGKYFDHWKKTEVMKLEATDFICQMAEVKALHANAIIPVRQNFLNPEFPEFKEQTVWSLFNAVTCYTRNQRRTANPLELSEESQRQTTLFKKRWDLPISVAA